METLEHRRLLAGDLLPDLVTSSGALANRRFGASAQFMPGRTLLRFDNLIGNVGQGALEIAADQNVPHPEDGQIVPVAQRIYQDGGGVRSRPAGVMMFHDEGSHHHFHFEDFALYNLRAVAPGGGPGEIVRAGGKAGFCIVDFSVVQESRPDRPAFPVYRDCFPVGGISVGWGDLYDYKTDYQWIDVTGLPTGQYYLESTADPDDRLQESNETNNTTRVLITLNVPRMGDANGDGQVNAADLKIVLANNGKSNQTWATGDFTGDGKVNLHDYQVLETAFNRPTPAAAPVVASASATVKTARPAPVFAPAKRPALARRPSVLSE